MFSKGLLVTAIGLAGVFLVLGLFFVTIKLLQKIGNDNEANTALLFNDQGLLLQPLLYEKHKCIQRAEGFWPGEEQTREA